MADHWRFHRKHQHLHAAFGEETFGKLAERIALFFGTPYYIVGQTIIVIIWIIFNGYSLFVHFDPYPFILLNLAFSTQAAYAAPLILLAQTRQAERDKHHSEADALHREELAKTQNDILKKIDANTETIQKLTQEVHAIIKKQ